MAVQRIDTLRGSVVQTKHGRAELVWHTSMKPKYERAYSEAQKYVDSEILRLCEPYIPLKTSMLIKSGILGTVAGSGEVKWIAPYARYQYYLPEPRKTRSSPDPNRGSYWFERMWIAHGRAVLAGARQQFGKQIRLGGSFGTIRS
jgi:hypothetical protein